MSSFRIFDNYNMFYTTYINLYKTLLLISLWIRIINKTQTIKIVLIIIKIKKI
jgi:hypothetical protein